MERFLPMVGLPLSPAKAPLPHPLHPFLLL